MMLRGYSGINFGRFGNNMGCQRLNPVICIQGESSSILLSPSSLFSGRIIEFYLSKKNA